MMSEKPSRTMESFLIFGYAANKPEEKELEFQMRAVIIDKIKNCFESFESQHLFH